MDRRSSVFVLAALLTMLVTPCYPQGSGTFSIEGYRSFLNAHQFMTSADLQSLHSAGRFVNAIGANVAAAAYFDSINAAYHLTENERTLLNNHGFVVTERLRRNSFGEAFLEIYNKDLPVFVSTDAVLHALHMSWDAILMDVERTILIQKLDTLLSKIHNQLPALAARYSSTPAMKTMMNDLDVYLAVPRMILGSASAPKFAENMSTVQNLLSLIKSAQPASFKLFAQNNRTIDFSQFTIRGHYTQSPDLGRYFQAMIWLGRTELYLVAPKSDDPSQPSLTDVQRQVIDAVLLKEAAEAAAAFPLLAEIDGTLQGFVGESDNVTLSNVRSLVSDMHLGGSNLLLDSATFSQFQGTLRSQSYAFQRINSQILISDPMNPEQIRPASAFLLLGQRFVIDSYVTGSVVYDKILDGGAKVPRMLPSTLDVLFALGNDAAAQLLDPELNRFHYAPNLAAVRYLVDSYDPAFWQGTIYNGWLNSIRSLNPPADRKGLPAFMQTAAWWQEKMNTQLASWAELRHDFILYAKQSYTAGTTCSYPESYVEPLPAFYAAVKSFADGASAMMLKEPVRNQRASDYFAYMGTISDTLQGIAEKELSRTPLTLEEIHFLKTMLYDAPQGCGTQLRGWYPRLYFTGETGLLRKDLIVADVHTAPTDESGNPVGWVLHAGTGPLNLGVVVTERADGMTTAFVGPVASYYEHVSTNFKRLTDEEWKSAYTLPPSFRPSFVKLYLADSGGTRYESTQSLLTGIELPHGDGTVPTNLTVAQNYPNPFNSSTIITFSVPQSAVNAQVRLEVYDVQGRLVKRLLNTRMPPGNYATRWNGTTESGAFAASGVYFYQVAVGGQQATGKMSYIK
jgi:hypothetical protein